MDKNKIKLTFLSSGIVITGSAQSILIPLMTIYFKSLYFILIMTSIQIIIGFLIMLLCVTKCKLELPKQKLTIFFCGLFNALMGACLIYSSNPSRTPSIMQSIITGLGIIPSVIITKYVLKKQNDYNKKWIVMSIIFLLGSLLVGIIPLIKSDKWNNLAFLWILMYLAGVIFRSAYNTMFEKYMIDVNDFSLKTKVTIIFWERIVHLFFTIGFFGLEYVIGESKDPLKMLGEGFANYFTDYRAVLELEGFIFAYFTYYLFSVSMNAISTNYNMIVTVIICPVVGIFFSIFPNLNPGFKFKIWVIIVSLVLSCLSMIFWFLGESNKKNSYLPINSSDEEK